MDILQLLIIGIIVGSIIGLGAMGLTLSYGVMKFANSRRLHDSWHVFSIYRHK